jgi:tetratricopeptide (TPR) repeat protein
MGRLDEALQTIEFALQLDPLSPILQTAIGGCYYRKRMYKVAVLSLEHNLLMKPGFNHTYWSLARAYEQLGRYSDARKAYETALDGSERNPMILGEWGHCLGVMGQAEEAAAVLDELKEAARARYVSPLCAAFVHLGLSQSHEAIRCLQRAAAERSGAIIWVGVDPRFDALRGHSAFKEILSAAGLFG